MIKIFLKGKLATEFGDEFEFDVFNLSQALRALFAQLPDFKKRFIEGGYEIFRRRKDTEYRPQNTEDLYFRLTEKDTIIIAPTIAGAATGAFILFAFAFSYVVGKLLTPRLELAEYPASEPTVPTFLFEGPTNISAQGVCIPLIYGRMRTGSVIVSESVNSVLVPPEAVTGDIVFAIWKGTVDTQRIIDVVSEGEIEGLVNGETSIFLNETPVLGAVTTLNFSTGGVLAENTYQFPTGEGANYAEDQLIRVEGFINSENNGFKTISSIDGDNITVRETLVVESAGPSVIVTGYLYNFEGVVWSERLGTSTQDYVPGFSQTEQTFSVGAPVEPSAPVVRTISGADLDAILITIKFPRGLYRYEDWSGYNVMWVRVLVEIRPASGTYETVINSQIWSDITAPLKIDYRAELPAGVTSWDIRVSKVEWKPTEADFYEDDMEWSGYTTVIDAKLSYPNTALYSLALNAKDFSGQSPNRSYEINGIKLKIPDNYDPITRKYTGIWAGTFQIAWSNNPAWVLYDLLTNARYGLGKSISESQIDKFALYEIARFCDASVNTGFGITSDNISALADRYVLPAGHEQTYETGETVFVKGFSNSENNGLKTVVSFAGTNLIVSELLTAEMAGSTVSINHTEPRYRFNGVLGKRDDVYKTLSAVISNFRASIFWGANGEVGFSQERDDKEPVKLVTPANVVGGMFTYSGDQISDRHSVALVSWNDPDNNYETAVEVVEDADLIAELGWKPVDIVAFACTSRGQAHRCGKYTLVTERYENERVTYQASFDHADLQPGDIIEIADPAYSGVRFGGRIAARTISAITLDAPIELEMGETYEISVIMPDGSIEDRSITNASGPGQTVMNLAAVLPDLPVLGSLWTINASNVATREFTVASIRETEKNIFEIGAVLRLPNKFEIIENDFQIEPDSYSVFDFDPSELPVVTDLSAEEYTYEDGGSVLSGARASWNAPTDPKQAARVSLYELQCRRPDADGFIPVLTTSDLGGNILSITEGIYKIRVRIISAAGASGAWVTISVNLLGAKAPPSDVENFSIQTAGATSLLSWDPVPELDLSHYQIRYTSIVSGATWGASVLAADLITGNQISLPARIGTFLIKAFDVYGIESANAALAVSAIAGLLSYNVIETFTESPDFSGEKDNVIISAGTLQLGDGLFLSDWITLSSIPALIGANVVSEGFYYFKNNPFDLGGVYSSRITAVLNAEGFNRLTSSLAADGWGVALQLRTTEDDPGAAPVWSNWKNFGVGDYTARGIEFRVKLNSYAENITPRISELQVIVDMPDRIVGESDLTCPSAGLQVDYSPAFQVRPALAVDSQNLDTGDYKTITDSDETGFFVQFFDSTGSPISRTFDYIAKGYGGT